MPRMIPLTYFKPRNALHALPSDAPLVRNSRVAFKTDAVSSRRDKARRVDDPNVHTLIDMCSEAFPRVEMDVAHKTTEALLSALPGPVALVF